jgi:hypothetical protein
MEMNMTRGYVAKRFVEDVCELTALALFFGTMLIWVSVLSF